MSDLSHSVSVSLRAQRFELGVAPLGLAPLRELRERELVSSSDTRLWLRAPVMHGSGSAVQSPVFRLGEARLGLAALVDYLRVGHSASAGLWDRATRHTSSSVFWGSLAVEASTSAAIYAQREPAHLTSAGLVRRPQVVQSVGTVVYRRLAPAHTMSVARRGSLLAVQSVSAAAYQRTTRSHSMSAHLARLSFPPPTAADLRFGGAERKT